MHKYSSVWGRLWPHKVLPIVGIVLMASSVALLWVDAVRQPYIPAGFSYSADVVGTDSYYDLVNQRFSGERYSQVQLSYVSAGEDKGVATIQNVLRAVTITGDPVAIISQQRNINRSSGKSLEQADPSKPEYLFAPRNLKKGQPFTFRHVTYDAPAVMHYTGQEELFGLTVYHYETQYETVGRLEQKNTATGTLPPGQGMEYEPRVQVWVEPVSGWLVKLNDDTTTYTYDKESGKRLQVFNHFVSQFTDESVKQHVDYAKSLKRQQVFARQTGPVLLIMAAFVVVLLVTLRHFRGARLPVYVPLGIVGVTVTSILAGWALQAHPLVTVLFADVSINPLSCICFGLAVSCMALLNWPSRNNTSLFLAGLLVIFASLQMLGKVNAVPFSLDLTLFRTEVEELSQTIPSRMTLFSAFAFLLLGLALARVALSRKATSVRFALFLGGVVTTMGATGLCIRLLQLDKVLGLSLVESISGFVSVLLIVCGFTFLQILQRINGLKPTIHTTLLLLIRPALATLPLILLLVVAQLQQNAVGQKLQARFDEQTLRLQTAMSSEAKIRSNALTGAVALFNASYAVEQNEWSSYVQALDIAKNYPDILGVGYAKAVPASQVAAFTAQTRQTYPDYTIFPTGSRPFYVPLLYTEPLTPTSRKAVGLDLFSETVRHEVIERARDSGVPSISGKIVAEGVINKDTNVGFVMAAPQYRSRPPTTTTEQRRQNFDGVVVAGFDMKAFMEKALQKESPSIDVQVYSGLGVNGDSQLYDRYLDVEMFALYQKPRLTKSTVIYVENHPWTIRYKALPAFRLGATEERAPMTILLGGTAIYFFLLITLYPQLAKHSRVLLDKRLKKRD
ncbi:MAG TPA: porin PorA family protein [Verrucomicrobiae bacterium]|nr:porin PorA family protein [Verrucomicrobiae bacterium]